MTNLIGQHLDKYEIIALLGKGGMATVYRARQASMERDVAIKVIKPDLAETSDFLARFQREARTVASLSHIHILKVFDYGQQGSLVYLVMELLTGGSLADLIRKGPLPLEETSRILDQMASALDYAHRRGVVHRDLKPQNILLDDEGNVHLTDFGIAKLLGGATVLTQSGMAMGTPAYMSPEQWKGQAVDARADIYALGVMLFEMLTGRLPFVADTPYSFMHKHVNEQPPSVRTLRAGLPSNVDRVIRRAMAKDPNRRFASAGDVARAFKAALPARQVVEPPEAPESPELAYSSTVPEGLPTRPAARRIRPALLIGMVVVAVALIGLIVAALSGRPGGIAGTANPTEAAIAAAASPAASATTPAKVATSTSPPITKKAAPMATRTPNAMQTITAVVAMTDLAETVVAEMSATKAPTATPVPSRTASPAATRTPTPVPPTFAPTSTPVPSRTSPPTATRTPTPVPPTFTPTPVPPTITPAPSTPTFTATSVPPTNTPAFTATPVPPTVTPVPPTVTPYPTVSANKDWMERSTTFDDGVEMVVVPPGCFIMGSTDFQDAQPVTKICFDLPFAMDKYEVTNEQFNRLKGKAQNASRWTGDQRPREMITWSEVLSFCKTRGARLPTEAEWEYAARGPDGLAYPWGNDFADDKAVYTRTSGGRTADVGSMPNGKSWVGAFDMAGNVWEWTSTIQTSFMFSSDGNSRKTTYLYPYKASDGRENQYNGSSTRVVRGGSWINSSYNLRTAYRESRHIDWPAYKGNNLGFRCARSYP